MPDKSITQFAPIASDVNAINVIFDGAGAVAHVDINVTIRDSDGGRRSKSCSTVATDFAGFPTADEAAIVAGTALGF